jgi:hypothetical protein
LVLEAYAISAGDSWLRHHCYKKLKKMPMNKGENSVSGDTISMS